MCPSIARAFHLSSENDQEVEKLPELLNWIYDARTCMHRNKKGAAYMHTANMLQRSIRGEKTF